MRSILIASFHPLISRNLFQTEVLGKIASDTRVFILCPDYKKDFFESNFSSSNVSILPIKIEPLSRKERFWKELGNTLLHTSTIRFNRRERYLKDRKIIGYVLFLLVHNTLGRVGMVKRLYQAFCSKVFFASYYDELISQYHPDLVFSTDIFHDEDVRLLASAKRLRVRTIGMVRSWDNATNKGVLPVIPGSLIVHNEVIQSELREFHLVRHDVDIVPTGIPQFDYYKGYRPKDPDDFFTWTKLSPHKKTILFAPTGSKFVDDDAAILQVIHDAVRSDEISGQPQILVRFPPGDTMDLSKLNLSSDVKVVMDYPGVEFDKKMLKDREMSDRDMVRLADTLYYSDVLVSVGSTLCIDITAFNKPVICPNFRVDGVPYEHSMSKMYDKYHYDYLLRTGACDVPKTKEAFVQSINESLRDPMKRKAGRDRLTDEQMWRFDGQACERIATEVKLELNK